MQSSQVSTYLGALISLAGGMVIIVGYFFPLYLFTPAGCGQPPLPYSASPNLWSSIEWSFFPLLMVFLVLGAWFAALFWGESFGLSVLRSVWAIGGLLFQFVFASASLWAAGFGCQEASASSGFSVPLIGFFVLVIGTFLGPRQQSRADSQEHRSTSTPYSHHH